MHQIYIVFIEVIENGEDYDILMKKKRQKKWRYFPLRYRHVYLPFLSFVSIYHQYLFIKRVNVLHECKAWELRVCGPKDIYIQLDQFSKMNQLESPWKVWIHLPDW